MKYTTPEIAVESIETKDVITWSINNGATLNEIVVDGEVVGQEVVIPDVSILL